jgi:hypothetical protein
MKAAKSNGRNPHMSLTLVIALNTVLCAGLLGGLAWFMAHPRKLVPHEPVAENVNVVRLPNGTIAEVEVDQRRAA